MLGMRYDPIYTHFTAEGTTRAPEIVAGRAFNDPLFGIRPTDRLQLGETALVERDAARLELRRSLLAQFNHARRNMDADERMQTFTQQQQMAFSLLTSGKMHDALDYTREATRTRESYGMTLFGQSCLAARRLIEAGAKFVTVIWDAYGLNAGSWDTHHNHYGRLKEFLLPVFDQTFSALILDLEQRGLLDETLVLVLSEHGRTPQIDSRPRGAGPPPLVTRVLPGLRGRRHGARQPRRANGQECRRRGRKRRSRPRIFSRLHSTSWASIRRARLPIPLAGPCRSPATALFGMSFWANPDYSPQRAQRAQRKERMRYDRWRSVRPRASVRTNCRLAFNKPCSVFSLRSLRSLR